MNGPRRTIAALDVPTADLEAQIEDIRRRLPLDDPARHALDPVDSWFAADAAAHPEHVEGGGEQ